MSITDEINDFLRREAHVKRMRRMTHRADRIEALQRLILPVVTHPSDYALLARLIRQAEETDDQD